MAGEPSPGKIPAYALEGKDLFALNGTPASHRRRQAWAEEGHFLPLERPKFEVDPFLNLKNGREPSPGKIPAYALAASPGMMPVFPIDGHAWIRHCR